MAYFPSEDEAQTAYHKGQKITEFLNNDVVMETIAQTEQQFMQLMADSHTNDSELRDRAHAAITALRNLRANLIKVAEDGDLAASDLGLTPIRKLFSWR